ncbi:M20 peptidase aminoacylase family protein [Brevibacillus humidisoli]|uniref:M20 peptidase aminoacylase family protein n=1 Tax=Brevibacillus humidisoli TaxID=2895522 RepID=UPI001E5E93A2|nr:M20 peptidase aminoacylase family protein [Brevibacillus humidisoli]UFJ41586.1 M20 peptidase aminoacylase family protein [Brevibacillus humidisoli]
MTAAIRDWVNRNREEILATYYRLHDLAEVSWQERETTAFLCQQLEQLGIAYQTFDQHTGVIAVWEGETDGPTVGMRADMDALWQNVDGVWKANHSCGHDAHMTMVLSALRCLKETDFRPKGRLKVIFQPAEEVGAGAKALLAQGMIDDIDYLLGIHVRPIQELSFGTASPAIYHGAVAMLRGKVRGVQAHAARPHLGVNVIDSLAAIVGAVNAVRADPTLPASAKVTKLHAGGDNLNIIPDEAEFGIDLRAQTNDAMESLLEKVSTAARSAGSANGAEVELEVIARMNAAVPNPTMEQVVSRAIAEILGADAVVAPPVTPGGEDFHFYVTERAGLAATMIGLGTDLTPGLHHPQMRFDLDALHHGTLILCLSAMELFAQSNG